MLPRDVTRSSAA